MPYTGRSASLSRPLARPHAGPLHSVLLAFPVALYPSALITDVTYLRTSVVQWTNFSQWLIAGADVFAGLVLAWALISALIGRARGRNTLYLVVVAVMFVLGVLNAFHHSQDGWISVGPMGVALSALCTLLAFGAAFLAHPTAAVREFRS